MAPFPTRAELARELLRYKMVEYSAGLFCAAWLDGLEFDLWDDGGVGSATSLQPDIASLGRECRDLAEIADGWWVFEDKTQPDKTAPVFVSLARWREILRERGRDENS